MISKIRMYNSGISLINIDRTNFKEQLTFSKGSYVSSANFELPENFVQNIVLTLKRKLKGRYYHYVLNEDDDIIGIVYMRNKHHKYLELKIAISNLYANSKRDLSKIVQTIDSLVDYYDIMPIVCNFTTMTHLNVAFHENGYALKRPNGRTLTYIRT